MKIVKKTGLLKKCSSIGLAAAFVLGINGCSDDSAPSTFTPFERIATLEVVKNIDGSVNYADTYSKAQTVADAIHLYIEKEDDVAASGFPANWIIGGSDEDPATLSDAILQIPSIETIDPDDAESGAYKVKVMDICNSYYAKKALGATNVVTDDDTSKVANGFIHAPTLPCEVTVYNDGENIYVDMLNPEAIFSLFFSDVVFGPQMEDAAFADEISKLPGAVKNELKAIVYHALDAADLSYTALSEKLGPAYTEDEILSVVENSPYNSPYLHYGYMKNDGTEFTSAQVKEVAATIIETMADESGVQNGIHNPVLDSILSEGSSWRSGRELPLGLPGVGADDGAAGYKNFVIEACSPKYAKEALATGRHHAPALPCEITVTAIESTSGSGDYDMLVISFLEPGFMFNVLFKDAFAAMSTEEMDSYKELPVAVLDDLQKIVNYSVSLDLPAAVSGMNLIPLGELTYDMIPVSQ
ncbi:MAG: hypothetical protein DIZ80_15185 [endosymbiont of Galathealinum brachiosum]|uniref:Uncharacterized protein n=1 Tax=endosymbiont of Galathealinum brachiosum TaxID=2200906 RepID=A0A370D976_9GAMM|nr:MAG: hypothetical protein DIZ80_15185 [endosymbiont of Galathealinum brachiosum]